MPGAMFLMRSMGAWGFRGAGQQAAAQRHSPSFRMYRSKPWEARRIVLFAW